MKRQTRPFTVEIKSSRTAPRFSDAGFAVSRTPRATPPVRDLWSGVHQDGAAEKGAKFLEALSEADRVFGKLAPPKPVAHGSPDSSRMETSETLKETQGAGRRGVVLPDLRPQLAPERTQPTPEPPSPDMDRRSVPSKSRRPRRSKSADIQPEAAPEAQPRADHAIPRPSGPVMDEASASDQPVATVRRQTTPAVSPRASAAKPRRSLRSLDQSWAYRTACRKAERRGEPPPVRSGVRRKQR
jgi:hypothetical protein